MNERMSEALRRVGAIAGVALLVIAVAGAGYLARGWFAPLGTGQAVAGADHGHVQSEVWTCSMHPQIRQNAPGQCPICGMDLVPVTAGDETGGLRTFTTSEAGRALMDIQTSPVERRFVTAEIRMVGKIDYDQTRLAYIAAWVNGRLDKLHVNYTGVPVTAGAHMVEMYSPELLTAQQELIQAVQAVKELKSSDVSIVREITESTVAASREKLRLLGLAPDQIKTIETTGKASDRLEINSPASGLVVEKHVQEGQYVATGARIYTIADLSVVWVRLEAYESDLTWLRYGQKVEFTTVSYPGQTFTGTISLIDPILDSGTRTVNVRVNAPNADGRLKPGMFVTAVVRAEVAVGGKVMAPDLAGKWICSMHPEVVKDAPGACDVCHMPLVRTESLGYVSVSPAEADKPLVIPASAPLITGKRAVVYVEVDPSLLTVEDIADWGELLMQVRAAVEPPKPAGPFLNRRCPIMGTSIDPAKVPPDLTREYAGGKVAFCCATCPQQWDALTEEQKKMHLAAASRPNRPLLHFWNRLDAGLRADLLATPADEWPAMPLRYRFVRQANDAISDRGLHDPEVWKDVNLPDEGPELIEAGPGNLPARKLTRLNRLYLQAVLGDAVRRSIAKPTYEGRQIVLGERAGDYYIVRRGLYEGERLVTRGNFKIDSALQIQARPSMMGEPLPAAEKPFVVPPEFGRGVLAVLSAVDSAAKAVEDDGLNEARGAFERLEKALREVDADLLVPRTRRTWDELAMRLTNDAVEASRAEDARRVREIVKEMLADAAIVRQRFELPLEVPAAARKQLDAVLTEYLRLQEALASDDLKAAAAAAGATAKALADVDASGLAPEAKAVWKNWPKQLSKALTDAAGEDIESVRKAFALVSEQLGAAAGRFGLARDEPLYQMRCPMAFDNRGAVWLQTGRTVRNPYFGASMPRCGEILNVIEPVGKAATSHEHAD